jgi:type VI protein secretion system component VasF
MSQETLLYFVAGAIVVLVLWLGRLGKQLEAVHDSLRTILAQPIAVRQAELEEHLAAKRRAAKRRNRNTLTIVLVIAAALAVGWYYFSGGQSWRTFFQ